ncbi:MAG: ABC transporter ATP-binding protein [Hyphomicrobiales bacterium]
MSEVPRIEIDGLGLHYRVKSDAIVALEEVSLDIPPRSFLAIVGPSGCGKTTLLKVLSGLLRPTRGRVLVEGRPIESVSLAGQVGYVFQRPLLLPWRSALDNVALTIEVARKEIGRAERLEEAGKWLKLTGLEGFEHRLPHELSGGMQQRVSLSRALAFRPPVLMMDEPFAALDEITRETMQDELLRLWSITDSTIIFITHSIGEAVLLADRVVVMTARPGRVEEIIEIPFPRPRDDELRGSQAFTDIVQHIRHKLRGRRASAPAMEPAR